MLSAVFLIFAILVRLEYNATETFVPDYEHTVQYWVLMLRFNLRPYLGTIAGICFVVISIVLLHRRREHVSTPVVIGLLFIATIFHMCTYAFSSWEGSILEHRQSVSFDGHTYQLLHYHWWKDMGDTNGAGYVVYECDASGFQCVVIKHFDDTEYGYTGYGKDIVLLPDASQNTLVAVVDGIAQPVKP